MQEMSCIKELYLSANTLQSKFNLRACSSLQKNTHRPDMSSKLLLEGRGGEENATGKKNIYLHSIL